MNSYYDEFTAIDWEKYATVVSNSLPSALVVISIASFIMGYSSRIGIYTLITGFFIAIWEAPAVYACIPSAEKVRVFLTEKLYFKKAIVRSIVYILLSILTYVDKTICIAAGVLMNINSLLLIFAAINRQSDVYDGLPVDPEGGVARDNSSNVSYKSPLPGMGTPLPGMGSATLAAQAAVASVSSGNLGNKAFGTF